jgi:cytochrome c553
MSKRLLALAGAALLGIAGPALAGGDYEAGKKLAEEKCKACHGEAGNKPITPETPRLAGQYYDYLFHALNAYKKGARQNPMMSPMAQPLSKEEMKNLATYFSKQQGLATKY